MPIVPAAPHSPPLDGLQLHIRQRQIALDEVLGRNPRYGFRTEAAKQIALSAQRPRTWPKG